MKKSIDILVEAREDAGVKEPYLFSRPGMSKPYRGTDCIRKFCNEAQLQNPSAINSTKLRKQLAALAQVLNLSETSQDILATFQGHDIQVHREFYRLPESTLQVAKVWKILHGINNGTIHQFKGKDFDQIDFAEKETIDSEAESDLDLEEEEDDDNYDSNTASLMEVPCNSKHLGKPRPERSPSPLTHAVLKSPGNAERLQSMKSSSQRATKGNKTSRVQRHTWTAVEKTSLERQFRDFIKGGKTPGQIECLNAMKKEKALAHFTWRHVKFAVKNIITSRQRMCEK